VASLVVVTVGRELKDDCVRALQALAPYSEGTSIYVSAISRPHKRRQIGHGMADVHTPITIIADDHDFWGPRFVTSVLAPLEDDQVAAVATKKRVRRVSQPCKFSWSSIVNFLAQNYLERHNWELRSTLDGGITAASGTSVYRSEFLNDFELMAKFCNESFFFGVFGKEGLDVGCDHFLARHVLAKGLKIKFQDTEDATVETTLGEWPRFNGQLLHWARTTFRSSPTMLMKPRIWANHTWSTGMIYLASITNFAIIWDTLLIASLVMSLKADESKLAFLSFGWLVLFVLYLITTKLWKIIPALLRTPSDCALIPIQIVFAYIHSFYKLWALLTFWNCDWSGRNLDEINAAENGQAGIVLDDLATVEVLV
jgi:cellulose synthase/poly-beta-1,6-N-acetylglucosamine synthase-like glycosyltransferase